MQTPRRLAATGGIFFIGVALSLMFFSSCAARTWIRETVIPKAEAIAGILPEKSASAPIPLPPVWAGADHPRFWLTPPARRDRLLEALRDAGIRVVRIVLDNREHDVWWESPPHAVSIENPIGQFHWESLENVDRLMAACRKYDVRLWICIGGMDTYAAAFGTRGMYESREAINAYTRRLRALLTHYNAELNRYWYECNDVVLAWEIPSGAADHLGADRIDYREATALVRSWYYELSRYSKSIDPDTPVALSGCSLRWHPEARGDDRLGDLGFLPDVDFYALPVSEPVKSDSNAAMNDNLSSQDADAIAQRGVRDRIQRAQVVMNEYHKSLVLSGLGAGRPSELEAEVLYVRTLIQIAEDESLSWVFHRLGDAYDTESGVVTVDDTVWTEVIAKAGRR